jgi:hypothetical protein
MPRFAERQIEPALPLRTRSHVAGVSDLAHRGR